MGLRHNPCALVCMPQELSQTRMVSLLVKVNFRKNATHLWVAIDNIRGSVHPMEVIRAHSLGPIQNNSLDATPANSIYSLLNTPVRFGIGTADPPLLKFPSRLTLPPPSPPHSAQCRVDTLLLIGCCEPGYSTAECHRTVQYMRAMCSQPSLPAYASTTKIVPTAQLLPKGIIQI